MCNVHDYVTLPQLSEMWMKALLAAPLLGMALLSLPAAAQVSRPGSWVQAQGQQGQPRGLVPRDQRQERRMRREPDERRRNSLTEEQRRELRRDIDQANRDIYRRKFKH